jgi:hypothetical protein
VGTLVGEWKNDQKNNDPYGQKMTRRTMILMVKNMITKNDQKNNDPYGQNMTRRTMTLMVKT